MTEKIYLETFEKCPGSVYFPLLTRQQKTLGSRKAHWDFCFNGLHLFKNRIFYFIFTDFWVSVKNFKPQIFLPKRRTFQLRFIFAMYELAVNIAIWCDIS